jgi:hypothetical protein
MKCLTKLIRLMKKYQIIYINIILEEKFIILEEKLLMKKMKSLD